MLLKVENLSKSFPVEFGILGNPTKHLKAVQNVSFELDKNEVFSIVGESGSGKSTIARILAGIYKPTSGSIIFDNKDLLRQSRGKDIQLVFQDPESALDPRRKASFIVEEGLLVHKTMTKTERKKAVREVINAVGLTEEVLEKYPHQLSGGQKQRVAIARCLILKPKLLILDEPTSALDVSVQAQILNLLIELKDIYGLTYILISHDLRVVSSISDRLMVMYLGLVVEYGKADEIFKNPLHPYTKSLLQAVPELGQSNLRNFSLTGEIPSPLNPPEGCVFRSRCPTAFEKCRQRPNLMEIDGRKVRCHLYDEKNLPCV